MSVTEMYSRGNSIRYSFILPCSIFSIASVSFFSLSSILHGKREGKQIDRERRKWWERLYLEKREGEEKGERWRGMGLYMRGCSSSPRCIAHRTQCLVTHVVHNICDQEADLVCAWACMFVWASVVCVHVHLHGVCPQRVRRLCLNVGCEMKHYSAL